MTRIRHFVQDVRGWWIYYRHDWGPLRWTCRDCRLVYRKDPSP